MSVISYVTRIHFADDVLADALLAELENLNLKHPLVIIDQTTTGTALVDRLAEAFVVSRSPVFYAQKASGPFFSDCKKSAARYITSVCDGIIGFGGRSCIDQAKITALLVSHKLPLSRYYVTEGGNQRIKNTLPPVIAIPTIAGTGTETSKTATVVNDCGQRQYLVSDFLVPRVVICDPTLTLQNPPALTASAGMTALTCCIEAYCSLAFNPPADGIALDGVKRIAQSIQTAVVSGDNIDARREIMAAALNGSLASQKGLGGVHAMSDALLVTGGPGLAPGDLKAVLLPGVVKFNSPAVQKRYEALKSAMGIAATQDFSEAIEQLAKRIGLPTRLSSLGISGDAVQRAAAIAEQDHRNRTNPRRAKASDYLSMMQCAL